jgi:hypothetical protein
LTHRGDHRRQNSRPIGVNPLNQYFNSSPASQGSSGRAVIISGFIHANLRLAGFDDDSSSAGDIDFQTSAADAAPGSAIGSDEHSRAGLAVAGAFNADDGRQRGGGIGQGFKGRDDLL